MIVEEFLRANADLLFHGSWLVLGIALVAGLLSSAICPFTLPVGLGVAGVVGTAESRDRGTGFPIAVAFFAGLVLSLTVLGAVAGALGLVASQVVGQWWMLIMAGLAFFAALAVLSGPSLRLPDVIALRRPGVLGAFLYGLVFSLGTPATSLLLVLTVAAAKHRPAYGALLALGYGVGRGLPFLLLGLCSGVATRLRCRPSWSRAIRVTTGSLLLVITGYYLWIFIKLS
ncbi:cytochrome c biogenesis CcdA family protein [Nitrospira sp. Kam-Ns4a]